MRAHEVQGSSSSPDQLFSEMGVFRLFLALDSLFGHLDEAILGFAIRKVCKGRNGLFGVVVGKGAGLLDAVALEDYFTSLREVR